MTNYPQATIVSKGSQNYTVWILCTALALAALFLGIRLILPARQSIAISFKDAHFLKTGDLIRYRSVAVGEITAVEPAPDLQSVRVEAILHPNAGGVARQGSRFWIVRPKIDLEGARGLETVLGSHYIRVQPGTGPYQDAFAGLEEPPVLDVVPPGTVEITLAASQAEALRPGMAVTYRNTRIGIVSEISLFRNAGGVDVKALIFPEFAPFVVPEAVFCRASGAKFSAGLFEGLSWSLAPLQSMMTGEIHLLLPDLLSYPASSARRFPLREFAPKEAEAWRPSVALGPDAVDLPPASLPRVVPAEIPPGFLGSAVRISGIGFQNGLVLPDLKKFDPSSVMVLGKTYEAAAFRKHALGFWILPGSFSEAVPAPPARDLPVAGEDVFAVIDPAKQPFFLPSEFLRPDAAGTALTLQSDLAIRREWEGVPVVDRSCRLAGMLVNPGGKGTWEIRRLPADLFQ
ncbi:MAG TPA: MlaD family protein [Candidatus Ozemobacteraceae bacterium]|nr:MlaD family protein [Candidatus Ozemobacteraceae bacterium]HQG27782.1 MlaD family protein [Candidatus Ozemobacteraceae bacterium]